MNPQYIEYKKTIEKGCPEMHKSFLNIQESLNISDEFFVRFFNGMIITFEHKKHKNFIISLNVNLNVSEEMYIDISYKTTISDLTMTLPVYNDMIKKIEKLNIENIPLKIKSKPSKTLIMKEPLEDSEEKEFFVAASVNYVIDYKEIIMLSIYKEAIRLALIENRDQKLNELDIEKIAKITYSGCLFFKTLLIREMKLTNNPYQSFIKVSGYEKWGSVIEVENNKLTNSSLELLSINFKK